VHASGTMTDVVRTLDRMYPSPKEPQAWFGHPQRPAHSGSPPTKPELQPEQNVSP
jgi:hypothetical protein